MRQRGSALGTLPQHLLQMFQLLQQAERIKGLGHFTQGLLAGWRQDS
ncbi:MAG TPA: hypothetical protein VGN34_32035 [Ktedonobacteraceae bacterium]